MNPAARDSVTLHGIRIGDRGRTARGWLVVSDGAVRGILSAGQDGEVLFGFSCDRRITPEGVIVFRDIEEARVWLEKRLPTLPQPPRMRRSERTRLRDERIRPETQADAERALLTAAIEYGSAIRDRPMPDDGPLRRLWDAFVDYRHVVRRKQPLSPERVSSTRAGSA